MFDFYQGQATDCHLHSTWKSTNIYGVSSLTGIKVKCFTDLNAMLLSLVHAILENGNAKYMYFVGSSVSTV